MQIVIESKNSSEYKNHQFRRSIFQNRPTKSKQYAHRQFRHSKNQKIHR